MCTVLLRLAPGEPCPLLLGAVRDEFVDRAWDPPGPHWGGRLLGGRDRTAGGTWLAVDPDRRAVAAVLNGVRLPPPAGRIRPSRGALPLMALRGEPLPDPGTLDGFDGFHLVLVTATRVQVWSWDGDELAYQLLEPGDHVIVNAGVDLAEPLVAQRLSATGNSAPDWVRLLADDAVLIDRVAAGRRYGSTSTALVAIDGTGLRYDFNPRPRERSAWYRVWPAGADPG